MVERSGIYWYCKNCKRQVPSSEKCICGESGEKRTHRLIDCSNEYSDLQKRIKELEEENRRLKSRLEPIDLGWYCKICNNYKYINSGENCICGMNQKRNKNTFTITDPSWNLNR